jgi:hypothetical protein
MQLDLTDEETLALLNLLTETIEGDRLYFPQLAAIAPVGARIGESAEHRYFRLPAVDAHAIGCSFHQLRSVVEIAVLQIRSAPATSQTGCSTRRCAEKKDCCRLAIGHYVDLFGLGHRWRI